MALGPRSSTSASGWSELRFEHLRQCRSEVCASRAELDHFGAPPQAPFPADRYTAHKPDHGEAQCTQPGRVRVLLPRSCPQRCPGKRAGLKTVTCAAL